MKTMKLLDCTLRDGGYYNNWDFNHDLVQRYLNAMALAGVDIVEIGFRTLARSPFKGALSHSTERYLNTLEIPDSIEIAIMVNASEFFQNKQVSLDAVESLFLDASASRISLVRLAAHYEEIIRIGPVIYRLRELGYRVVLNLMQAGSISDSSLQSVSEYLSTTGIEALYFADSFGNMGHVDIERVFSLFRTNWSGPIGFHSHDNMFSALGNSLFAIEKGASWLDATVMGMGRGAGNAKLEEIILELCRKYAMDYQLAPVLDLMDKDFKRLKEQYSWGANPLYYVAASYNIHPTYVQEMLSDGRYSYNDVMSAIDFLRSADGRKFEKERIKAATNFTLSSNGSWSPKGMASGRDLLIVANGPSSYTHRREIEEYIKEKNPIVLALNYDCSLEECLVDYWAICNPKRLTMDLARFRNSRRKIIMPVENVQPSLLSQLSDVDFFDFGFSVTEGQLDIQNTQCMLPYPLVAGYALAIAASSSCKRILLCGFDGYGPGDKREAEMNTLLRLFIEREGFPSIISVTPTSYQIAEYSIYSPLL